MSHADAERTLVLIRHAEARSTSAHGDHERALTAHGEASARALGQWLAGLPAIADLTLCSTALRARQTWELAAASGTGSGRLEHLRAVYAGEPDRIVELVREEADDAETVFVVGHNPSIGALASILSDGEGSTQAHEVLAAGFSPATAAVLHHAGPWSDLGPGSARLVRVHRC